MAKKDKVNVATSGFTPVQAGRVVGDKKAAEKARRAAEKAAKAAQDRRDAADGGVSNIVTGTAHVGCQADVIIGDLNIRM